MASCCRRYRARRLKALGDDPQLLVIRPAPPSASLYPLKPFKLSTALMAVHKDCYAPLGLIRQGGPRRRETRRNEISGCNLRATIKVKSEAICFGFPKKTPHRTAKLRRRFNGQFSSSIRT